MDCRGRDFLGSSRLLSRAASRSCHLADPDVKGTDSKVEALEFEDEGGDQDRKKRMIEI